MLAPVLLADREQQQQQILTPASAKATPAQRHAHHCSICGAARRTRAHRYIHTHTYTHACAHAHTYENKRAHRYTQARTHTYTRINTQTHMHKHAGTQAHTHTHTLTHAYAYTHGARDGLCQNFSVASDATSLVNTQYCFMTRS
jgi:hypothetical protein